MIWTKYTIKTTTKDADMVSAILMDYDINDVQIENNVQLTDEELNQMYADFVKELPEDDGSCMLSFYVEYEEDGADKEEAEQRLDEIRAGLEEAVDLYGIEPVELVCEDLNSDDWENNWKEFFKPFTVDEILIVPTWEEIPEEKKEILIRIDPGMAFGTGTHETTRLCLRALQKDLKEGDHVLDLGCGSGILGIAAVKLKAADIVSVDIDEQAVRVAKENFEINEVPDEISRFFIGNVVDNKELQDEILKTGEELTSSGKFTGFDIVVVNILADVINLMMPSLDQYLKAGGILITSGILNEKEQLIRDAVGANPNLELLDVVHDGDWVSITAKRK